MHACSIIADVVDLDFVFFVMGRNYVAQLYCRCFMLFWLLYIVVLYVLLHKLLLLLLLLVVVVLVVLAAVISFELLFGLVVYCCCLFPSLFVCMLIMYAIVLVFTGCACSIIAALLHRETSQFAVARCTRSRDCKHFVQLIDLLLSAGDCDAFVSCTSCF